MPRREVWKRWLYVVGITGLMAAFAAKEPRTPPPLTPTRPRMSRKQVFAAWLYFGIVAVAFIVFFEIDALLSGIQGGGLRSYGTSVFTAPSAPWDVTDLSAALQLWLTGEHHELALSLIRAHVVTDFAFIAAYLALFRLWIGSEVTADLFASPTWGKRLVSSLAAVDVLETALTYFLPATPLALLQWVTISKWALVLAVAAWLLVSWLRARGLAAARRMAAGHQGAGPQALGSATGPLVIAAGVFLVLVAFPGEGALAQLPDVLRYQFTEADWLVRALSIGALGAFVAAIAAAGFIATGPVDPIDAGTWPPLLVVGGLSGGIFVLAWLLNGSPAWGTLTPLILLAAIVVIALLRGKQPIPAGRGSEVSGDDEEKGRRLGLIAGVVAVGGGLGSIRAAAGPLLVQPGDNSLVEWGIAAAAVVLVTLAARWLAGPARAPLSRVAVVGIALAIVTGSVVFQPGLLWAGALGMTAALVGGFLTWLAVTTAAPLRLPGALGGRSGKRWPVAIVFAVITLAALLLAVNPHLAGQVGTSGALVIGLAFITLLACALVWLSRKFRPWWITENAGLGPRPPWAVLLLAAWLLASPLTDVGYHDARVDPTAEPYYQYLGLGRYPASNADDEDAALATWLGAQGGCELPRGDEMVYPMLLMAAPGGGIRASYWTAKVLDLLTPEGDRCSGNRLFLLSGVSGGSVGIAGWLASREAGVESAEVIAAMAADEALAAGAAGLYRDLFHPLLGIADSWGDRAELLEEGWVATAKVGSECIFGDPTQSGKCSTDVADLVGWDDIAGQEWTPVVIFNGSSVAESCRAVLSNVAGLPASPGIDCRDADAATGPLIVSTDPRADLLTRSTEVSGNDCPRPNAELSLITSALLSARFPVASPSGALHGCHSRGASPGEDETTRHAVASRTFVVDGGYYENSGLLSLLGVWDELAPSVAAYNADAIASGRPLVEPWVVIASNHYTANVAVPPPDRPPELLLPVTTFLAARDAYGQATFEQLAVGEMRAFKSNPCGPPSAGEGRCVAAESKVVSIAPTQRPTVAAPLGWVLSEITRTDLDENIERLEEDKAFMEVAAALGILDD